MWGQDKMLCGGRSKDWIRDMLCGGRECGWIRDMLCGGQDKTCCVGGHVASED